MDLHKEINIQEYLSKEDIVFFLRAPITLDEVENFLKTYRYEYQVIDKWKSMDMLPYFDRYLIKVYSRDDGSKLSFILRNKDKEVILISPTEELKNEFIAFFKYRIL